MHIPFKTTTKVTVLFYTKLTDFRKRIESSQASTARPSGNGQHVHETECWEMVEIYWQWVNRIIWTGICPSYTSSTTNPTRNGSYRNRNPQWEPGDQHLSNGTEQSEVNNRRAALSCTDWGGTWRRAATVLGRPTFIVWVRWWGLF